MPYLNGRRVASVERFTEMSFSTDQQTSIPSERSTAIEGHQMSRPSSSVIQPPPQPSSATPTRSIIKNPNRYQNLPQNPQQYRPDSQFRQSNEPVYRSTIDPRSQERLSLNGQKTGNGDRLADVYSNSDDTVQFAGNLRSFINKNVPFMVWIGLAAFEILAGLFSIFFGSYNYSMCEIQPLMPLYLILSGSALIVHGIIRSAKAFPNPKRRSRNRPKKSSLYPDLLMHGLEGIALLYMLICVILGCVWVYGSRTPYVQFMPNMFERDYCDQTLYWVAWWSVTIHLVVFGLLILAVIFILIYGSMINS
ncbi:unnamed protein product [Bursaphelenchus xylophilus]|uniref:(pine wood nematode) hypothetical protein n=1 Tax=Bursaphelenchus xylophilus TaxID=6326 RepID=A0A1I7SQK8_BURXY|nr:unnamed protein product [Bursaphelenchus xylophilus]CAG9110047.1 unnamed protein product [Bursaphelenchus xylophilus]